MVTGAGGCIGSWVLALLARAGVPACAFDLSDDKRRPRLLVPESDLAAVPWRTGDIADSKSVIQMLEAVRPCAIIHLAALQVPFCKADPVAGAKVNVVGTVNVFEAARQLGIKRFASASSVAAHGAIEEGLGTMRTLYGAYKLPATNRSPACIRTTGACTASASGRASCYGVGRDQGLTSTTTVAILAATGGKSSQCRCAGGVSSLCTARKWQARSSAPYPANAPARRFSK